MDLQQAFDLDGAEKLAKKSAMREALKPYGLPEWSRELIVLLACDGRPREISGQQCFELSISKRKAGLLMGCSPNTFMAAVENLNHLGVLEVVEFGQRRTYFLSRDRVNQMAPIAEDPIDELGLFTRPPPADQSPKWSALVSAGQSARVREKEIFKPRGNVNREPCARGGTDQLPTRLIDLTDEQVRDLNLRALRSAFGDAVSMGWLRDEPEDKRKFLAIARHAARSAGIHHPAKAVYAAVKSGNFDRATQEAWDWAAEVLRPKYQRACE